MSCDDTRHDLDAFVDRELDSQSWDAVRAHLDGCADCRRRVSERESLGRLVRATPYYSAPEHLRARVAARARRTRSTPRVVAWAAAAVLVLSVGAGLTRVQWLGSHGNPVIEDVVNGHVRSLMADHLFDVQSTDQHTVKPWFLGKLDFSPPVVDLAASGYPLVGGRLDYLEGRPVAALVYERRKHAINLFVSPAGGETNAADAPRTIRGFHVRHWVRDGMSFWAVSDLNETELGEFARALQGS